jgi:D-alanyl-D-alanine dipeptidase
LLIPVTEEDGVRLDLRYATADNITGKPIYRRPVALLRPEAHRALSRAVARAAVLGVRFKLFDAFRPLEAQWALWNFLPDPQFVADPRDGSALHPKGVAVDLTLLDGDRDLDMGTGFDDMTAASALGAVGFSADVVRNRALLLGIMVAEGWESVASEWWHYQLPGCDGLSQFWAQDVPNGPM